MADGSIHIDTKINRKGAEQGLKELKKEADTKVKQLERGVASAGKEVEKLNEKFTQSSQELQNVQNKMDGVSDKILETYKDFAGGMSENKFDRFIQSQIEADSEYKKLQKEQEQLNAKVKNYKTKLEEAKGKQTQLNSSLGIAKKEQTDVNSKLEVAKRKTDEISNKMKSASKNTKMVSVQSLGISKSLGGAVKKLAKYGVALIGFTGIYNLLKSSMNEWLNGSSQGAKQLQADISNLKANIGSALAPVIQSVLQIFYKILAVVGAIVKAFANINIFAKNTAKSTASTASSSKQVSNNLASFDSLDILSKDSGSGSGGASTPEIEPTDLTALMAQYEDLAERIKNIFEFIFEPFKKAWETTGQSVISSIQNAFNGLKSLGEAVGNSFKKIWENGTVQTTAETLLGILADILNIIGNVSQAWANAWNNNGNGDLIVQNLADAFNNLLGIVKGVFDVYEQWTGSESFQTFANSIISICTTLSGWFQIITDKLREIWENGGKQTFEKLLEFCSKLVEAVDVVLKAISPVVQFVLDIVTPVIEGIVRAIGYVIDALSGVLDFVIGVFTGDWERAMQGVQQIFEGIWNAISSFIWGIAEGIVTAIIEATFNIYNNIMTTFNNVQIFLIELWTNIKNKVSEIIQNMVNGIKEKFETAKTSMTNIFNNIKDGVVNIFNNIKTKLVSIVSDMWTALKNKFGTLGTAIGDAISGAVKTAINWILNKIESVVNSFFRMINSGIGVINAIPGVSISQLGMISIPKLARGGIVNQPTQAIIGEAGREAVLPLENNTEWMDILADKISSRLGTSSNNDNVKELVLKFEGELAQLARIFKPYLDEESQRKGYKLVAGGAS